MKEKRRLLTILVMIKILLMIGEEFGPVIIVPIGDQIILGFYGHQRGDQISFLGPFCQVICSDSCSPGIGRLRYHSFRSFEL